MDLLPVAAFVTGADGRVSYLSAGWEELTGHERSHVLPNVADLVHPGDRAFVAAAWQRAISERATLNVEYRTRFASGDYRFTRAHAVPFPARHTRVGSWFGTLADTHDLHLVREAMTVAVGASLESARDARARAEFGERLIEASEDRVEVVDLDARLLSMSASGRRRFGLTDGASLAGTDWVELWNSEHRALARANLDTARAGDRGKFVASVGFGAQETWWDVSLTPIRDADGRPESLLAVSREITDVFISHRALAQSEERYRVLTQALPGVTFSATRDGLVDYVSEGAAGASGSDGLGNGWQELLSPSDRATVVSRWNRSIETAVPFEAQLRTRASDGSYRWMLARAHPQYDEAGAVVRWIGVSVDIDEQKRADEKREKFVRLADASDEFIAMADLDGKITYMNDAMLRALELESIESPACYTRFDLVSPEDLEFLTQTIVPTQMREGRWLGEFRFRSFKTKTIIPIMYNAFILRDEARRPVGLASVSRDLRDRRRVEIGMRALAETGAAMYGSLDFEGTIRNVARAVARSFASYCVVDAVNTDGSLRTVAESSRGSDFVDVVQRAATARVSNAEHPIWRAIRRGESTLVPALPDYWTNTQDIRAAVGSAIAALDLRSALFVPIRSQQDGRVYGALSCMLDGSDARGKFTVDDLRFAEEIAVRAGLAFDHARAYERERRIAVTLQEASLPQTLPALDHLYLSADYRPGNAEATIGGDWYDAFVLDDGRVAITIGDVLGNGLGAAVTMGKVRQAMQSVATVVADPNIMLDVADRTVRQQSGDAYATAIAGIYDLSVGEFTFASAGHPGPIVRLPDGTVAQHSLSGLLLGMRPAGETVTKTIALAPGSTLLFFTDGLSEATRDIDEGMRRIYAALEDASVASSQDPAHALVECVLRGEPAMDDIAVLVADVGPSARFDMRARSAPGRTRDLQNRETPMFFEPLTVPEERVKTLTIPAQLEEIAYARRAVRALLGVAKVVVPRELGDVLELATGELVANAVEHGAGPFVDVALRVFPSTIELAITNDGESFAQQAVPLSEMLLAERGRGLAMLTALGCRLAVECIKDGRCTVTATIPTEPGV